MPEQKTENWRQSNDSPFGGGIWRKLKTLLAPCLLLLATLFTALPAWAAAKTEDVESKSCLRFEGGLDASKIYAGHRL